MASDADSLAFWPTPDQFWDFTVSVYQQSGTADALIEAQDWYGLDVNLALFFLWCDRLQYSPTQVDYSNLVQTSEHWQSQYLVPHRQERRAAKGTAVYDYLLSEELNLEQQCQAALLASLKDMPSQSGEFNLQLYLKEKMDEDRAVKLMNQLKAALSSAEYPSGANQTGPAHD